MLIEKRKITILCKNLFGISKLTKIYEIRGCQTPDQSRTKGGSELWGLSSPPRNFSEVLAKGKAKEKMKEKL